MINEPYGDLHKHHRQAKEMSSKIKSWVVKPLVPEAVYTDRREFLDYFYEIARNAAHRRTMSTVLLGQRRMGKTEIFKRVVNRLFFEQDPNDPHTVVPVYFSFPDKPLSLREFSQLYLENFIRYYIGFLTKQPEMVDDDTLSGQKLIYKVKESESRHRFTRTFKMILNRHESVAQGNATVPDMIALETPRRVADIDDSTIVVFLDEFQNTRLPHYNFDIVGAMKEAVESPNCPHFVTGSAMSILAKDIIGRGSLFGRFDSDPIKALTEYWGAELARRCAKYYKAKLENLMAPVVSNRCGGNPFYITAVIRQAAKLGKTIDSEETLNNLLAVDLSSGFIWAELNDQVTRWIERINEYGITKWVLYLSALEEDERIEPERIQRQLAEKEGTHVDIGEIRDILIHLSRGDLLDYMELGGWFRKTDDPILLDFLKAWGKFEVEGRRQAKVITDTVKQYDALKRKINDHKGYLAEVYLAQILWNGQRQTFPARYFHSAHDIKMPDRFWDMHHRMRIDASSETEIDVYASDGREIWFCESKWWENRKVGTDVVNAMLELAEKLKDFEGREHFERERPMQLYIWLFAHNGVTSEAEALLRENRMYWSDRRDLDELIRITGLRPLPDFKSGS